MSDHLDRAVELLAALHEPSDSHEELQKRHEAIIEYVIRAHPELVLPLLAPICELVGDKDHTRFVASFLTDAVKVQPSIWIHSHVHSALQFLLADAGSSSASNSPTLKVAIHALTNVYEAAVRLGQNPESGTSFNSDSTEYGHSAKKCFEEVYEVLRERALGLFARDSSSDGVRVQLARFSAVAARSHIRRALIRHQSHRVCSDVPHTVQLAESVQHILPSRSVARIMDTDLTLAAHLLDEILIFIVPPTHSNLSMKAPFPMKSTVLSALITALNDVAPFDPFCAVALISCGMDESWPQSCTSAELSSSQITSLKRALQNTLLHLVKTILQSELNSTDLSSFKNGASYVSPDTSQLLDSFERVIRQNLGAGQQLDIVLSKHRREQRKMEHSRSHDSPHPENDSSHYPSKRSHSDPEAGSRSDSASTSEPSLESIADDLAALEQVDREELAVLLHIVLNQLQDNSNSQLLLVAQKILSLGVEPAVSDASALNHMLSLIHGAPTSERDQTTSDVRDPRRRRQAEKTTISTSGDVQDPRRRRPASTSSVSVINSSDADMTLEPSNRLNETDTPPVVLKEDQTKDAMIQDQHLNDHASSNEDVTVSNALIAALQELNIDWSLVDPEGIPTLLHGLHASGLLPEEAVPFLSYFPLPDETATTEIKEVEPDEITQTLSQTAFLSSLLSMITEQVVSKNRFRIAELTDKKMTYSCLVADLLSLSHVHSVANNMIEQVFDVFASDPSGHYEEILACLTRMYLISGNGGEFYERAVHLLFERICPQVSSVDGKMVYKPSDILVDLYVDIPFLPEFALVLLDELANSPQSVHLAIRILFRMLFFRFSCRQRVAETLLRQSYGSKRGIREAFVQAIREGISSFLPNIQEMIIDGSRQRFEELLELRVPRSGSEIRDAVSSLEYYDQLTDPPERGFIPVDVFQTHPQLGGLPPGGYFLITPPSEGGITDEQLALLVERKSSLFLELVGRQPSLLKDVMVISSKVHADVKKQLEVTFARCLEPLSQIPDMAYEFLETLSREEVLVAEHFILNPLSRLVMESRGSVPEPFHESLVERVMATDSDPTIILPLFPLMAMEQIQRVLVRLLARPESEVIIRLVLNYLFGETSDAILSRRKRAKQEEQTNSGVKPSVFFSALITLPEFAATSSLTSPQARTDSNLSSPPPSHGMEVDEQIRSVTCESVTQLDPNFLRNITSAISFCLSRTDLFPIAVLKNSFLSLIELSSLPCLFMRTLIQSYSTYPDLRITVVSVLNRLARSGVWENDISWRGFIECVRILQMEALSAVFALPETPFRDLFSKLDPEFRRTLHEQIKRVSGIGIPQFIVRAVTEFMAKDAAASVTRARASQSESSQEKSESSTIEVDVPSTSISSTSTVASSVPGPSSLSSLSSNSLPAAPPVPPVPPPPPPVFGHPMHPPSMQGRTRSRPSQGSSSSSSTRR